MEKDQLDGLLALRLVAEKRSFTAAAEALNVSPTAVSKMIKQLEARLGVVLLTRTTRSTAPTEAGELFLKRAIPGLDQIFAAFDVVSEHKARPAGLLRINAPRLFYMSFLEPIVTAFVAEYPEITVELFLEDAATDVVAKGFDAGIRVSDILAKDMVAIKLLGPVNYMIVASPDYWQKYGRPQHPKDLLNHNCIRVRVGDGLYDRWEFENKGKPFMVNVHGSLILNDGVLAKNTAANGGGVMYINQDAASEEIKSGRLEAVLQEFSAVSTGYYLYYPQVSQVQPKLRAFIDYLKMEKILPHDATHGR